jgi:membrane associated rhomboid family serine protease
MPIVTYSIIAICAIVYVFQLILGDSFTSSLLYIPVYTGFRPWTIVTSMFAHASPLHLLFNMYSLFVLGRILEPAIGRVRFAALYFISGFGGCVAVLLLNPVSAVLGASGAIFGLLGALFIIQRHIGGNTAQLLIVIVLNLALGFFIGGISWQAHVGGVVTGAAVGLVYARTRNVRQRRLQVGLTAGIAGLLVATTAIGLTVIFGQ